MGILDRIERIAYQMLSERVAARAPAPREPSARAQPFDGAWPTTPANIPTPAWSAAEPTPPPRDLSFRAGYHDRSFRPMAHYVPGEWTPQRVRAAVLSHEQGTSFLESSALALASTRYAPTFGATEKFLAPMLAIEKRITGGSRGLARLVREEVEAMVTPAEGLLPSPYFPPVLWGHIAFWRRWMGFAALQHVYGEPDPETGVRVLYTRPWPVWAMAWQQQRRTFIAQTEAGPVDMITGDGKFTVIADIDEPQYAGVVRCLGEVSLSGKLVDAYQNRWLAKYSDPKLVGTSPPTVAPKSPEGEAFLDSMEFVQNPEGIILLPNGATLKFEQISAEAASVFIDMSEKDARYIENALLGTDGTGKSAGVYPSPWEYEAARAVVARVMLSLVRCTNAGCIYPYVALNYGAQLPLKSMPVLEAPLPDPQRGARVELIDKASEAYFRRVERERAIGVVDQDRLNVLAVEYGVEHPVVLKADEKKIERVEITPTTMADVHRVDELRALAGKPALGDERGTMLYMEVGAPKPAEEGATNDEGGSAKED